MWVLFSTCYALLILYYLYAYHIRRHIPKNKHKILFYKLALARFTLFFVLPGNCTATCFIVKSLK